jgi:hypothetical protein
VHWCAAARPPRRYVGNVFFAKKCCNISKNVGTFSKMLLKTFWDPSVFSEEMLEHLFQKNVSSTFYLKNVVKFLKILQQFVVNNYEVGWLEIINNIFIWVLVGWKFRPYKPFTRHRRAPQLTPALGTEHSMAGAWSGLPLLHVPHCCPLWSAHVTAATDRHHVLVADTPTRPVRAPSLIRRACMPRGELAFIHQPGAPPPNPEALQHQNPSSPHC